MTNERLIEEAAKAIREVHAESRGYLAESPPYYSDSELYARTALAVFEKARAPTDDERAIAACIDIASTVYGGYDDAQGALSDIHMMLAPIAARRSEVPEPSAERLDYYDPARQDRISEHDCVFEDGEWWFGHGMPCKHPKLHAEPQGEPSDAHIRVAEALHADDCADDDCDGSDMGHYERQASIALSAAQEAR